MASNALKILYNLQKDKREELGIAKMSDLQNALASRAKDIYALEGEINDNRDKTSQLINYLGDAYKDSKDVFAPAIQGLAAGMKSRGKKERLENFLGTLRKIQDFNNHIFETKMQAQKAISGGQAISPMLEKYLPSSFDMSPEGRANAMKEVVKTFSRATGENLEVASVDGANPFIVTIRNTDTGDTRVMDFSRDGSRGEQIYNDRKNNDFENYVLQEVERERQDEIQNRSLRAEQIHSLTEDRLERRKNANIKQISVNSSLLERAEKNHANHVEKNLKPAMASVESAQSLIADINKMIELCEKPGNADLFQNWTKDIWSDTSKRSPVNTALRMLSKKGKGQLERINDITTIQKIMNRLSIETIKSLKGIARPNVMLERMIKEGLPSDNMPIGAAVQEYKRILPHIVNALNDSKETLNSHKKTGERQLKLIFDLEKRIYNDASSMYDNEEDPAAVGHQSVPNHTGTLSRPESSREFPRVPEEQKMVKLQNANTGTTIEVTEEEAADFIEEYPEYWRI